MRIRTLFQAASVTFCLVHQGSFGFPGWLRAADSGYEIVERGQDFAVVRKTTMTTDAGGNTVSRTNQFTILENCLNYLDNGQWTESQDLIEPFPDGAIARHGPNTAIFSPDLNSESLFDIQISDGKRLRGGIRAIQMTDLATGKTAVLATVKPSAPGELLPPDRIVYGSAFNGLEADVMLLWKHNLFSQDLVIREQPKLPEGMNPDTTWLEVVTELIEFPQPTIRRQMVQAAGARQLEDDVVIHFGRLAIVMGKAFPVPGELASTIGGLSASADSAPVLKQWRTVAESGRTFLVESIGWTQAEPYLKTLPAAQEARAQTGPDQKAALTRGWPATPEAVSPKKPMRVAQLDYEPKGYVADFVIIPDQGLPSTFGSGQTYYIKTSYNSGGSVYFEPGCTIKFKNNANMLLYGPITFPDMVYMPVFTSRNDDLFGEKIAGVQNEPDSDGNPTQHRAAQAIWIYFVDFATTIRNARIRWAQKGIQYDANPGVSVVHTLSDSLFQECQTGVYVNTPSGSVTLSNVRKCNVTTPITGCCFSGNMTDDCGPLYTLASFAGIKMQGAPVASGIPDTMGAVGPITSWSFSMVLSRFMTSSAVYSAPHQPRSMPF